jgi:hypothetical protein
MYKASRIAVIVARIRFFALTRTIWNFPLRSVPQQCVNPRQVKRLRPSLPPAAPSIGRKPSELDQARFIGVKNKPELCEPFPHICQNGTRRLFLLKVLTQGSREQAARVVAAERFGMPVWHQQHDPLDGADALFKRFESPNKFVRFHLRSLDSSSPWRRASSA